MWGGFSFFNSKRLITAISLGWRSCRSFSGSSGLLAGWIRFSIRTFTCGFDNPLMSWTCFLRAWLRWSRLPHSEGFTFLPCSKLFSRCHNSQSCTVPTKDQFTLECTRLPYTRVFWLIQRLRFQSVLSTIWHWKGCSQALSWESCCAFPCHCFRVLPHKSITFRCSECASDPQWWHFWHSRTFILDYTQSRCLNWANS